MSPQSSILWAGERKKREEDEEINAYVHPGL